MTNLLKLSAIALAALVVTTTIAAAATTPPKPRLPTPPRHGIVDLECRLKDHNFWIINFGDKNVDSGRQVAWSSPTTDDGDVIMLPRMLAPGEQILLADVLSDVPEPFAPCSADFV